MTMFLERSAIAPESLDTRTLGQVRKAAEAADALGVLGYSRAEIASVLRDVDTATLSLEDIIKAALRRFSER